MGMQTRTRIHTLCECGFETFVFDGSESLHSALPGGLSD